MIKAPSLFLLLVIGYFSSNAQNYKWAKSMGGKSNERSYSIALDDSGFVYTTGHFNDTVDFDPGLGTSNVISNGNTDIFVSKLDAAGNFIWAKSVGGSSSDSGNEIVVDNSGNVFYTGEFFGTVDFDPSTGTNNLISAGGFDIFISKLDAAGNSIWAKGLGGNANDQAFSIALDDSGNVYTTGRFQGTADFDPGLGTTNLISAGNSDIFISKLDTAGNFIWAKRMGGNASDNGVSIAIDGNGNIYTTGLFEGTADFDPGPGTQNLTSLGNTDIFIAKLDATGNLIWVKSIGGLNNDFVSSIAVDDHGNVHITGTFSGSVDFDPGAGTNNLTIYGNDDVFILKLDAAANFIWAKSMGGTSNDNGLAIDVDYSGSVYTTGNFQGTADFDPGVGTTNLNVVGSSDIFVCKLDSSGNFIWAESMGGPSLEISNSIAVDLSGNVYTTGSFSRFADFNPGIGTAMLNSAGFSDVFISKLGLVSVGVSEYEIKNTLKVYPNPTKDNIKIDLGRIADEVIVSIRNPIGQEILKESFKGSSLLHFDIPGGAGLYFIEVYVDGRREIIKLIKD